MLNKVDIIKIIFVDAFKMYCASDKTIPGVSSSQSSKNVKEGKFVVVNVKLIYKHFWLCTQTFNDQNINIS